jgi:hypothetical protein
MPVSSQEMTDFQLDTLKAQRSGVVNRALFWRKLLKNSVSFGMVSPDLPTSGEQVGWR